MRMTASSAYLINFLARIRKISDSAMTISLAMASLTRNA
jgi:hypothetical protein